MVGNISNQAGSYCEVEVLGYPLASGGRAAIRTRIFACLDAGTPCHIVTLNPEMAVAARQRLELRALLARADMFVPDGVGLAWAAQQLHVPGVERYPGIELAEDLLTELARRGSSAYLLGSKPGVAERAAERLTAKIHGLKIAGCCDGYFAPAEDRQVAARIAQAGAGLLLAGMGFPRQEGFITEHRDELGAPIMIGVGGALEVFAGDKPRAPQAVQRLGLEWAYRSLVDLNRLKRLGVLPRFIGLVLKESLGGAR
jgi:N-acetylglucosaminyldiphosphoundecaprenol N-acetyl-beta-D-mannosaminyltransferase